VALRPAPAQLAPFLALFLRYERPRLSGAPLAKNLRTAPQLLQRRRPEGDAAVTGGAARLAVVVGVENAGQAADADAAKGHHARVAQVVYARRRPAAIVQLPQVVGGLMVAADCGARQAL
jgi:hypothetical protein